MRTFSRVLPLVIVAVLAYVAGSWNTRRVAEGDFQSTAKTILYYHCPMHPSTVSDRPGIAPCCGMPLEPVYSEAGLPSAQPGSSLPAGTIRIAAEKQQVIGLRTGLVEKTAHSHALRVLGRVAADETRIYTIKAGADGWIEATYANSVGSLVQKDEPLASFCAPDVLNAEAGYITTLTRLAQDIPFPNIPTGTWVLSSEDILRKLGMSNTQIEELRQTRQVAKEIHILAPAAGFVIARNVSPGLRFSVNDELYRIADLSHVWIIAELFESEAQSIRPGAWVPVSYPQLGMTVRARVSDVLPQFDPTTRKLELRLEAENPRFALRPGMFVDVGFPLNLPPSLSVPAEAVLDSGLRKSVFVDLGNGAFERRQVETGWRLGGRVEIKKGLMEGERIVTSGNFLVDSESRLEETAAAFRSTSFAPEAAAKAKDPVCGMSVDITTKTFSSKYKGRTYYFCSELCKQKFDKNPHQYIPEEAADHVHGNP